MERARNIPFFLSEWIMFASFFLADKPRVEGSSEVNEIGEQFENMRLTRDPSERLRMEDMLGQ